MIRKIAFALTPGIGGRTGRAIIGACGGVEAAFREKKRALFRIEGVGRQLAANLKSPETMRRAEEEMKFIEKYSIRARFITDKDYPALLKSCIDAPLMLFEKGRDEWITRHSLAIVGTRSPSAYGTAMTGSIVRGFKDYEICIVSGLAYGVDTAAHMAALDSGLDTVAVLGHGLDRIYPDLNRKLAGRIVEQGCLITEFPSRTKLNKDLFPRRNRIIAGLSEAVVVMESRKKGGGLITADIASSYNRDVFALPGRAGEPASEGPHFLIKTNRAGLVETADDIIYYMGWDKREQNAAVQKKIFNDLNDDELLVFRFIEEKKTVSVDEIFVHTEMQPSKVSAVLLKLEFEGMIKLLPGNRYSLL